jgi:hypothetical protein
MGFCEIELNRDRKLIKGQREARGRRIGRPPLPVSLGAPLIGVVVGASLGGLGAAWH